MKIEKYVIGSIYKTSDIDQGFASSKLETHHLIKSDVVLAKIEGKELYLNLENIKNAEQLFDARVKATTNKTIDTTLVRSKAKVLHNGDYFAQERVDINLENMTPEQANRILNFETQILPAVMTWPNKMEMAR